MKAKCSAARSYAGDSAEMICNRGMELMGSAGYAYASNLEKYMRDYKIVQMWLGGAQRDRLDIAQGAYTGRSSGRVRTLESGRRHTVLAVRQRNRTAAKPPLPSMRRLRYGAVLLPPVAAPRLRPARLPPGG